MLKIIVEFEFWVAKLQKKSIVPEIAVAGQTV
jgi:hypothetical protein